MQSYLRKASFAASSAPSGGGVGGGPGDLRSLLTRGLSEGAQGPAGAQAAHAWFLLIGPSTPWQPERKDNDEIVILWFTIHTQFTKIGGHSK